MNPLSAFTPTHSCNTSYRLRRKSLCKRKIRLIQTCVRVSVCLCVHIEKGKKREILLNKNWYSDSISNRTQTLFVCRCFHCSLSLPRFPSPALSPSSIGSFARHVFHLPYSIASHCFRLPFVRVFFSSLRSVPSQSNS